MPAAIEFPIPFPLPLRSTPDEVQATSYLAASVSSQNAPGTSPLIIDEVHTTSKGTYTINVSGVINEPLLCILTAEDVTDAYEGKSNQVNISWRGTSFDRETGTFVVNDCSFQLSKKSE